MTQNLLVLVMFGVVVLWPARRICEKAGFPASLGFLVLLPGGALILPLMLAVMDWPANHPDAATQAAGIQTQPDVQQ